jgi:hypothetical protein
MRTLSLSLIVGLWASVVSSEYTAGAPQTAVVQLDEESFPQAMKDPANSLWLLKFYAPW